MPVEATAVSWMQRLPLALKITPVDVFVTHYSSHFEATFCFSLHYVALPFFLKYSMNVIYRIQGS